MSMRHCSVQVGMRWLEGISTEPECDMRLVDGSLDTNGFEFRHGVWSFTESEKVFFRRVEAQVEVDRKLRSERRIAFANAARKRNQPTSRSAQE